MKPVFQRPPGEGLKTLDRLMARAGHERPLLPRPSGEEEAPPPWYPRARMARFVPEHQFHLIGAKPRPETAGPHVPEPFTRERVLELLREDVMRGFEGALARRGLDAWLAYGGVQLWNWVLEEGLEGVDQFPCYGLPLFKATAVQYGFPNPIGDDRGDEPQYAGTPEAPQTLWIRAGEGPSPSARLALRKAATE